MQTPNFIKKHSLPEIKLTYVYTRDNRKHEV